MAFTVSRLVKRGKALSTHSIARNSAYLYGVQICRKLFPLIIIPYLARILGADGWGTVAFAQSLGDIVALVIEFGFNLSATREISRFRDKPDECREIMAGVLGAQLLLSVSALTIVSLLAPRVGLFHGNYTLLIAACAYAVAQGFSPLWFFQGLEKMGLAAGLEISARLCSMAGMFLLVHNAGDGWKVLALQAMMAGISTVGGIGLAFRRFGFCLPSMGSVRDGLRKGWPLFVFRTAESFYGVGNSFVLGLFASPAIVGYFAVAEKTSRAIFGLLMPVRDSLYPRLAYLMSTSERDAARLARIGVGVMTVAGVFLSLSILIFAPTLIHMLAGPGFAPAVPVLRIMSTLPLILSITYSVGLQWLIPLGRDAAVNRVIICGGILNLSFAFAFAARFGAIGMACSVVSAELLVCTCLFVIVSRSTNLWRGIGFLESLRAKAASEMAEEF